MLASASRKEAGQGHAVLPDTPGVHPPGAGAYCANQSPGCTGVAIGSPARRQKNGAGVVSTARGGRWPRRGSPSGSARTALGRRGRRRQLPKRRVRVHRRTGASCPPHVPEHHPLARCPPARPAALRLTCRDMVVRSTAAARRRSFLGPQLPPLFEGQRGPPDGSHWPAVPEGGAGR